MLILTREQQDEFYATVGREGSIKGCKLFGLKHHIPSILLEAHLRRVKRLSKHAPPRYNHASLAPIASVADEEETLRAYNLSLRHIASQKVPKARKEQPCRRTHICRRTALQAFCRAYMRDPDAGCVNKALPMFDVFLREWLSSIIVDVRASMAESMRCKLDRPTGWKRVSREEVERVLCLKGDPYKVSLEAAKALEEIPVVVVNCPAGDKLVESEKQVEVGSMQEIELGEEGATQIKLFNVR
jgi:hypothetical protein